MDSQLRVNVLPILNQGLELMKSNISMVIWVIFVFRIYPSSVRNIPFYYFGEMLKAVDLLKKRLCVRVEFI